MTSWLHFMLHSAPWPWRVLIGASLPLWVFRVRGLWRYAGGWTQRYGKRHAVGIKPPRLLQRSDRSIGASIFIQEDDLDQKVQFVTCHELTHAFTSRLKLPSWLNEGLAMVTVDRFFETPTVRQETIETLERSSPTEGPREQRKLDLNDKDAIVYLYVRGYWITRYFEETQPGLLNSLLRQRLGHAALETKVAATMGMTREEFWSSIDRAVASFFQQQ